MSEDSITLLYALGLQSHLGRLCQFINKTILSPTHKLFTIQTNAEYNHLQLSCDNLVPVVESCLPWFIIAALVVSIVSLYLVYYQCAVVGKPKVVCHDPHRMQALTEHCPVLFEKYCPTLWAPHAYMQTIFRVAVQTFPKLNRRRESLTMKNDGGHICLDWYNEREPHQPTVLFLPGITGSSDENYIRHWIQDMTELGYRSVIFNYRGCGYSKLSTPKLYCVTDISDLEEAVHHMKTVLPRAPLMAVGVSMGTMQLIKYVSECKNRCKEIPFKALLLVSAIWNIEATDNAIHQPLNKHTLNRHLCNNFKGILKENQSVFEESILKGELCFDYHQALKCTNFRDFSEVLFFPMFGFSSYKELYAACCPSSRLDDITIPVLGLNAADDPFTPPHVIPEEGAKRNPNIILATTRRGGHIGFMEGLLPFRKTLMDRVLIQFSKAVFEHEAL